MTVNHTNIMFRSPDTLSQVVYTLPWWCGTLVVYICNFPRGTHEAGNSRHGQQLKPTLSLLSPSGRVRVAYM
jgi:hypothetical protein